MQTKIHVVGTTAFHTFARGFFNGATKFHAPFYLADQFNPQPDEIILIEKECGEMLQAEEANLKKLAKKMKFRLERVEKGGFTIFLFSKQYSQIMEALSVLQ